MSAIISAWKIADIFHTHRVEQAVIAVISRVYLTESLRDPISIKPIPDQNVRHFLGSEYRGHFLFPNFSTKNQWREASGAGSLNVRVALTLPKNVCISSHRSRMKPVLNVRHFFTLEFRGHFFTFKLLNKQ